jgi:hypothetical protein
MQGGAEAHARQRIPHLQNLDIGSETLTGVNDADYQPPFTFTG